MIQAWLAKKGAQLWAILAAIGSAALVVFGFYRYAHKSGEVKQREKTIQDEVNRVNNQAVHKVENAHAQAAREVETIQGAKDETDKVNRLSDDDVTKRLRDEWSRD